MYNLMFAPNDSRLPKKGNWILVKDAKRAMVFTALFGTPVFVYIIGETSEAQRYVDWINHRYTDISDRNQLPYVSVGVEQFKDA